MKSERRHELEHNELADRVVGLVNVIKPYSNHILITLLVVALGLAGYTMWIRGAQAETTASWDEMLASMTSGKPSDLELTADAHPNTEVGFLARTLAGDIRLAEGCNLVFQSKSQANQELEKAIDNYRLVIEDCRIPDIVARARYGLGRAYETQGDSKKATEAYKEVFEKHPDGVFAELARERFEQLGRPETKDFYLRFAIYKPKGEDAPANGDSGTVGEKPSFRLEDIPELGKPASGSSDTPLFTPQMKIDGTAIEGDAPAEAETPKEEAKPEEDAAPADKAPAGDAAAEGQAEPAPETPAAEPGGDQ